MAPTCTASGYTLHKCDCGDSYRDNITAALGHNYVLYSKDSEYIYQRCSRCGLTRKVPVTTDPVIPILPPIDPPVETASLTASESDSCTRVVATTVVEEHSYIYAGGKLLREIITTTRGSETPTTQILDFAYDAAGQPFALTCTADGKTNTYYYILNLQGDVVKLVTSTGTSVAEYSYDAWGNILTATGTMAEINPLRYRGYYYDSETGFYYLQSRYYDPANHRFINADVYTTTDATDAISCNMFAYCLNNPVMHYDSTGNAAAMAIGFGAAIASIIKAAVTAAVIVGACAATCYIAESVADKININRAQSKSEAQSSYDIAVENAIQMEAVYFGAAIRKGQLMIITPSMTFEQAYIWATACERPLEYASGDAWGLYTFAEADAMAMAYALGGNVAPAPLEATKRGHFPHYHTARHQFLSYFTHFHVWYGNALQ